MTTVIYCDESCHLERDQSKSMGIGAVWAPRRAIKNLSLELRDIKRRHGAAGELKWTKVSISKLDFYKEVVDWFFGNSDLHFRALVIPRKSDLDHSKFNKGSHDDFYYKMYFSMLNKILSPTEKHEIYIDIKDTRSAQKVSKLKEVLCNNFYDFTGEMIATVQQARSHELELMQLTDLLLGALVYKHRGLTTNYAKLQVIDRIEASTDRSILYSSPLSKQKFNVFVWNAQQASH